MKLTLPLLATCAAVLLVPAAAQAANALLRRRHADLPRGRPACATRRCWARMTKVGSRSSRRASRSPRVASTTTRRTARCPPAWSCTSATATTGSRFGSDYPASLPVTVVRRRRQGPAADLRRQPRHARRRPRRRPAQGLAVQRHAARRPRQRRDQRLRRRRPHRGRRRQRLDQPRHLLRPRQRLRRRRRRHRQGRRLVDPERRLPPAVLGDHGRRRQRRPSRRGRQRRQRREDRVARLRHAVGLRAATTSSPSGRTPTRATRRSTATAATTS